jgi:hypothetical protein
VAQGGSVGQGRWSGGAVHPQGMAPPFVHLPFT